MYSVKKTLGASAVALLLGLLGIPAQAGAQHFDCRACNNFNGKCEEEGDIKDTCYQGEEGGESFCSAWGGLLPCSQKDSPPLVRVDGTIDEVAAKLAFGESETAPSSEEAVASSQDTGRRYYRDCRGHVVARVYTAKTARQMRERTRTLVI